MPSASSPGRVSDQSRNTGSEDQHPVGCLVRRPHLDALRPQASLVGRCGGDLIVGNANLWARRLLAGLGVDPKVLVVFAWRQVNLKRFSHWSEHQVLLPVLGQTPDAQGVVSRKQIVARLHIVKCDLSGHHVGEHVDVPGRNGVGVIIAVEWHPLGTADNQFIFFGVAVPAERGARSCASPCSASQVVLVGSRSLMPVTSPQRVALGHKDGFSRHVCGQTCLVMRPGRFSVELIERFFLGRDVMVLDRRKRVLGARILVVAGVFVLVGSKMLENVMLLQQPGQP